MGDASENAERPILNIEGDLVGLGPLRRDLLPLYQRWINDLGTMRTLGLAPLPMTSEKEQDWYDRQSKPRPPHAALYGARHDRSCVPRGQASEGSRTQCPLAPGVLSR